MGLVTEVNEIKREFISMNKREKEKYNKQRIQIELYRIFYNEFKNNIDKPAKRTYLLFNDIIEREQILKSLDTDYSIQILNDLYNKELEKVYKIFKKNEEYTKERQEALQIEAMQRLAQEMENNPKKEKLTEEQKQTVLLFVLKVILFIIFLPFALIGCLIYIVAKTASKG